jgi:broad specificity phosphatase PhoE
MASRRQFVAGVLALAASPWVPADDQATWDRLRRGAYVILMRHASTEAGLGDPKGFRIGDCSTQRNLSEAGRGEARRIGARFREERVRIAHVYTSPWCRCRETAMLAFGRAEDWAPLSSTFDLPDQERDFTERVKKRIAGYERHRPAGNVVMVTHNVNIAALSRQSVAPGELVIMRSQGCCDARMVERLKAA